jgi:hypothetical protein
MKKLTLTFLVGIACAAHCFGAYDKRLVHVLAQLRECKMAFDVELPMVGGAAVGDAATPHEFYLLFPYVSRIASDADLSAMLQDKSPVVRIMAAKCIVQQKDSTLIRALDTLTKDSAKVYVAPFGCGIVQQTVGEVISELRKDPDFLGDPKEPIQPPQTTTGSSAPSRV